MSEKLQIAKIIYESDYLTTEQKIMLIKEIQESTKKTTMSAVGFVAGLPLGWAGYRVIRGAFDKCSDRCGTFKINNEERQACLAKCKEELKRKLATIPKNK
jgi:hypothetical protein